jgi:threonine/homoserine/homoserine lactone efflux protein
MSDPLAYLTAVALLLFAPGPTNTLLAIAGAAGALRQSLALILAALSAYLFAVAIIRTALLPVLTSTPWLGIAVKIALAVYLIWLAVRTWRAVGSGIDAERAAGPVDVFITTLLNPKGLIFALSILPAEHEHLAWYLLMFAVFVVIAGGAWMLLGWLLSAAAGSERARYVPRAGAVMLVVFAGLVLRSAA